MLDSRRSFSRWIRHASATVRSQYQRGRKSVPELLQFPAAQTPCGSVCVCFDRLSPFSPLWRTRSDRFIAQHSVSTETETSLCCTTVHHRDDCFHLHHLRLDVGTE